MRLTQRVLLIPALLWIPIFLSGCSGDGSTLTSLRENQTLRNAARAVLMGKAQDRAAVARRDGNDEALQSAANDLAKVDPVAAAEQLVDAAAQLDGRAQNSQDEKRKKLLEAQAGQKYREALRVSPEFPSRNPNLLNALGYFLAGRGENKSDFQKAERLTRASLKLWDELVSDVQETPMAGQVLAARKFMRANTRDSLAWALFRQGKFKNAKTEQAAAVKEAQETAPQVGEKVPADLYFHMAEIERALKNLAAAKSNYEAALKVEPDHALSSRALESLSKEKLPEKLPEEKPIPNLHEGNGALQARSTPLQKSDG